MQFKNCIYKKSDVKASWKVPKKDMIPQQKRIKYLMLNNYKY